jgi:hypothetical protein
VVQSISGFECGHQRGLHNDSIVSWES